MDLVVEHLLVEVHRFLSSFFPTRFSGWPTSYAAGMMPPYGAQSELRRIPLLGTSLNSPAPRPVRDPALRFPAARGLALQACRDALCQLARTALLPRSRGSALCSG